MVPYQLSYFGKNTKFVNVEKLGFSFLIYVGNTSFKKLSWEEGKEKMLMALY